MRLLEFLAICLLYEATTAMAPEGKYTIVGPGTIHSDHKYNVGVSLHHITEPATLKLGIHGPSYNEDKTIKISNSDKVEMVEFDVPTLEQGDYKFTVEGIEGLVFKNETKLNYDKFKAHVVIQTDKGKYKPGDKINYRIIFLDENLKPTKIDNEAIIWFEDSKRNRIKEVKNFKIVKGVYTGALELSEYALEGTWRLGVSYGGNYDQEVYFEVKKYVLPKYEIQVDATDKIAVQDGNMLITVKANYTYGKPVEGKVTAVIKFEKWGRFYVPYSPLSDENGSELPPAEPPIIIKKVEMVNGKAKIDVNVKQYEPFMPNKVSVCSLDVTATVEEEFTGVQINGTARSLLYPYRYHMNCINYNTCYSFHPGKDTEVVYKLEYIDGTQLNDTKSILKLTYTEHIEKINYWDKDKLKDVPTPKIENKVLSFESTMNETGHVTFKVNLPDLEDFEHFTHYYKQSLEYAGEKREIYNTYPYREPKKIEPEPETEEPKDFLRVEVVYKKDKYGYKLGENAVLKLNSSKILSYFVYNIVARGNLYKSEKIILKEPSKVYEFQVPTTFMMSPYSRLFIYYIDEDGVLFTAGTTISTDVELQNKISIEAPTEVKPGDVVPLKIKTEPHSFVGLMAIDRSVILLAENNDIQEHQFNWRLGTFDTHSPIRTGFSRKPGDYSGVFTLSNAKWDEPIMHHLLRKTFSASAQKGGIAPMGAAGAAMPEGAFLDDVMRGGGGADVRVRKNFAETWIFDNIEDSENGEINWSKQVPDTITSWLISGFSINDDKGIGVTHERSQLKTFQPFFVSIRLPYSVKRDEIIRVPGLVFNYLEKDLDVQLTLDNSDDEFEFTEPSNEIDNQKKLTKVIRVPANAARGADFMIRPKNVGNLMLKFTAISPIAGDSVHKTLKVVPEGVTQYANRAYFVNLQSDVSEFKENFELVLPKKIVPNSEHIEFGVVGDLFGPTLNNLENLVRLPMGCGEQTMSQYVLNMIILQYLETHGKETDYLKLQIKRFLETGYQKLLRYLHDDGSFSSFGPGTYKVDGKEIRRNGSVWLTAYVMRSLAQGSKYTKVDNKIFEGGFKYLASKQAANGSFAEEGEHFYSAQRSNIVLTSKVVLAFLENQTYAEQYKDVINKALNNLHEELKKVEKVYDRALTTFTLQKAKDAKYKDELKSLREISETDDDRVWWTEKREKKPKGFCCWWWWRFNNDIEITSYILQTLLEEENFSIDEVLPIIKWLVAQRNSYGGFLSTQDTVVGLQALTSFAQKANYKPAEMTFELTSKGGKAKQAKIETNKDNALLMQTEEFPEDTTSIEFVAKGTGAALVQISYQYNVAEKEKEPSFKVDVNLKPSSLANLLLMDVCSEYIGDSDKSNMAVLEISLPSGYTADVERYEQIEEVKQVRLVESKNLESMIVVYFESLKKGENACFEVGAYKSHDVSKQKPASIVLYDYYDADSKGSTFYELPKEE